MGTALISGLSFLAIAPPEHRKAEVAIGAEWQRHGDPEHDPVEAEPQGLVLLGREHGVEEDAAEGDLGPALVAERVIDDDPDDPAGDQVGQDQSGQDDPQVIPLPDRRVEDGVGGVVMPLGRQAGGKPDLADGPWPLAGDPAGQQGLECLEDLRVEAVGERCYQGSEGGDKLSHGAGLRTAEVSGVEWQTQDTKTMRAARSSVATDTKVRKASQTCISDHYATAESVWSSISRHSGEGPSAPEAPETRCCHICNRNAPSMSLNVGVTLCGYHERCRSTCAPA